ncbi:MAG: hypothetical protein DRR16_24910 [Candidatus Parabeggiatoa sp. nov. 3]|nr:MAG: hypothetical protein DRR00_06320 [Gammaproteobacteria bacterium]RKZ65485.1 MAG: hypothetical protein DRQ99_12515 [Gammaproteobacteria bacterium]RKZ79879.1 MAG: hypothetical protein DRR16_24910 [Gammaproteobacteria bacterium]
MKIQYLALILGISMMSVSYAQPNMGQGMSSACPYGMPPGQCKMHGPGMHGMRQGMPYGNQPNPQAQPSQSNDQRTFINMPPKAQQLMRQEMLINLTTLTQILSFLAADKLNDAAEIAETQMGRSAMGKHRGTGMGPGRFMSQSMRQTCFNMHNAASEFAQTAKTGNTTQAYAALAKVTATCVACHSTYRTR